MATEPRIPLARIGLASAAPMDLAVAPGIHREVFLARIAAWRGCFAVASGRCFTCTAWRFGSPNA